MAAAMELVYNEWAWGSEIISEINKLAQAGDAGAVKSAIGEPGLRGANGQTQMYPDIILRTSATEVLMGWELKMPDTPVIDDETIANAKEKARRLNTNSFIIWNVNDADLYFERENIGWERVHSWELKERLTRGAVENAAEEWKRLLREILRDVASFYARGHIRNANIELTVGESTYAEVLRLCLGPQVALLEQEARNDRVFSAKMSKWARETAGAGIGVKRKTAVTKLAQNLIVNWVNKTVFCHQLKRVSEDAFAIDELPDDPTVADFLDVFRSISLNSDFKSIFSPVLGQQLVSERLLDCIQQIHRWLVAATSDAGGEFDFTESLAGGLAELKGKTSGQFATPPMLARLLSGLTITRPRENVLDPCSGTGTIARAAYNLKTSTGDSPAEAISTIWASDKFSVPLAFTGINLAVPETMGEVQQVFLSDVAFLKTGKEIELFDPITGAAVCRKLPEFGAIVSNLPFVRFEDLADTQDKNAIRAFAASTASGLTRKSDLYAYILFGLRQLVNNNGRIGVIVSNSWLGASWGAAFRSMLLDEFKVEFLVSSGSGRWFKNAEVQSTLLVLSVGGDDEKDGSSKTGGVWVVETLVDINDWDDRAVDDWVDCLLSGERSSSLSVSLVGLESLRDASDNGLVWTGAARNPVLIERLLGKTCRVADLVEMRRGARPGAEEFFFVESGRAGYAGLEIEDEYLVPLFHRPGEVLTPKPLIGVTSRHFAFSCDKSKGDLAKLGHFGALRWIKKFEGKRNRRGTLYETAAAGSPFWYSRKFAHDVDFLIQLNPESVLAVYAPETAGVACSQRFVALSLRSEIDFDALLVHALMNTSVSYLWQELTGFGKGLGALDRNATGLKAFWRIPSPADFSMSERNAIVNAFEKVAQRAARPILEELDLEDRRRFDDTVFEAMGISDCADEVYRMLRESVKARLSVR